MNCIIGAGGVMLYYETDNTRVEGEWGRYIDGLNRHSVIYHRLDRGFAI